MADELFSFEWDGLKELEEYFNTMDERFIRICTEEMTAFGLTAEAMAKALAPRDSGDLEDSITASVAELRGTIFEVIVGTNLDYALRVHEQPERKGVYPKYERGVKYDNYYMNGDGEETRNKKSVKGYKPGRKYMTNAVLASEDDWNEMCQRIITRVLEGS